MATKSSSIINVLHVLVIVSQKYRHDSRLWVRHFAHFSALLSQGSMMFF